MNYFIKIYANWADEMDVYGCCVISKKEFDKIKIKIKKYFETHSEMTLSIGSNEELIFQDAEEVMECFDIKEISEEEKNILISLGLDSFGERIILDENWWNYNKCDE